MRGTRQDEQRCRQNVSGGRLVNLSLMGSRWKPPTTSPSGTDCRGEGVLYLGVGCSKLKSSTYRIMRPVYLGLPRGCLTYQHVEKHEKWCKRCANRTEKTDLLRLQGVCSSHQHVRNTERDRTESTHAEQPH